MANKDIDAKKLMKLDLYKILDVAHDASDVDIRKAYRKRALKCHPDKNPDNADAAAEFVLLTQALELLTDSAARAAYDAVLRARLADAERHRLLDSKRKRLKEDLEARENAARLKEEMLNKKSSTENVHRGHQARDATKLFEQEIARLRKEGSRLVEEEQERLKQQMREEAAQLYNDSDDGVRLRVKWTDSKSDKSGDYSEDALLKIFRRYGDVSTIVLSKKKSGHAIIEFSSHDSAKAAVEHESGRPEQPLTVTWLSAPGGSGVGDSKTGSAGHHTTSKAGEVNKGSSSVHSTATASASAYRVSDQGFNDFENMVMMRLRQAEEQKRKDEQTNQTTATVADPVPNKEPEYE